MGRPWRLPMNPQQESKKGHGLKHHGLFCWRTIMLSEEIAEISKRFERNGIGLKDALSALDMTLEDQIARLESDAPFETFRGLNKLIDRTVHGTKVECFPPADGGRSFHTLEIHTEEGEILGYLNMIYLKKAIPCFYLVYVEVMPPFRCRGLGNTILRTFMEFAKDRKALGLLDNIIPPDEPTYKIYARLGWQTIKDLIGNSGTESSGNYMVFIPDTLQRHGIKKELVRILFNLRKKRPVIDMHDNEDMVKRTIEEFRSVYETLVQIFRSEVSSETSNPIMSFMFTRLTTKLIGFRRRIASLIGYTGGESLEQISFSDSIKALPAQPYSLWSLKKEHAGIWGDKLILQNLPPGLREEPTLFIERLPLYRRPYLHDWMKKEGSSPCRPLKISDLLDLGFDPTRLREFRLEGVDYIFERISPHFFSSLVRKRRFLKKVEKLVSDSEVGGLNFRINPPVLIFRDRGNTYVLRKQVEGIHLQEALDQLRTLPHLGELNHIAGIDRFITRKIQDVNSFFESKFDRRFRNEIEGLAYFIPWDIKKNIPRICIDVSSIALETIWIA
jgi:GNAT superfamily N-acetyltransferase